MASKQHPSEERSRPNVDSNRGSWYGRTKGEQSGTPQDLLRASLFEALGWGTLGILHFGFVVARSSADSRAGRLLHGAVDLSQFVLLGLLAAVLRLMLGVVFYRRRSRQLLSGIATLIILAALGRSILEEDLANLLLRANLPHFLPARELAGLALAGGYLGWRIATARLLANTPAWLISAAGLAFAACAAAYLPPDYPGIQLAAAAALAHVASLALIKLTSRRSLSLRTLGATFALCAAAIVPGLWALHLPRIWPNLLRIPSSVAAPFLSRLIGSQDGVARDWIRTRYPEWFDHRSAATEVPPTPTRQPIMRPLVILFTIDSLRADVLDSRKHDQQLPALSRMRDDSIAFTTARSPSSSTVPAFASIFLGKYYSQLYWGGPQILPTEDNTERWPARLTAHGVHTIRITSLKELGAASGIATGFSVETQTPHNYEPTSSLVDRLIHELDHAPEGPVFAFLHALDSHAMFHRDLQRDTDFERYLALVAIVDAEVGRLREYLANSRLRQRTILVISADHGEAFGEHGLKHHGRTTYDELLRVPLYFSIPNAVPRRISTPVSLLDLGPTMLDLFGVSTPAFNWGQSLVPLLVGDAFNARRPIAAESSRGVQALVYPDGIKAVRDVQHHTLEIFDLSTDPLEQSNLNGSPRFPHERYAAGVGEFFDSHKLVRNGYTPPFRKF